MCTDVNHNPADEASTVVGSGNKEHSATVLCCSAAGSTYYRVWDSLKKGLKPQIIKCYCMQIIYFKGKQNAGYNNRLLHTSRLQNNFQSVIFQLVLNVPK